MIRLILHGQRNEKHRHKATMKVLREGASIRILGEYIWISQKAVTALLSGRFVHLSLHRAGGAIAKDPTDYQTYTVAMRRVSTPS